MAGLLGGLIAPIMGPVVSGLLGSVADPQPAPAAAAVPTPAPAAQQDPNDQGQGQGGLNLGGQNLARTLRANDSGAHWLTNRASELELRC